MSSQSKIVSCLRVIELLYIPTSLHHSIIQKVHGTHMGIEGSLRRAREAYYSPLMSAEVKDFISKCSACNTIKPDQCREELMPHELPERPWSKARTDLFTLGGKNFIVTVDYYSNFIEMDTLKCRKDL